MEKNQKIKGILFDLDGTLVDTAPDFVLSLNNVLSRHQFPNLDPSIIRSNVSDGSAKLTSLGFGLDKTDPSFDVLRNEFLAEYKINLLKNSFSYKKLRNGILMILNKSNFAKDIFFEIANKGFRF
jgi:phosphoglycolate phosphatase